MRDVHKAVDEHAETLKKIAIACYENEVCRRMAKYMMVGMVCYVISGRLVEWCEKNLFGVMLSQGCGAATTLFLTISGLPMPLAMVVGQMTARVVMKIYAWTDGSSWGNSWSGEEKIQWSVPDNVQTSSSFYVDSPIDFAKAVATGGVLLGASMFAKR